MRDFFKTRSGWQRGVYLIAAGCIALLLVLSTAQLVHTHATGHEDPGCALCYSAHQSVQASAQVALHLTVYEVANGLVTWESDRPSHNAILLPVNRPPPAAPVSL